MTIISVEIGRTGCMSKGLYYYVEQLFKKYFVSELQKIVIMCTVHIIREDLTQKNQTKKKYCNIFSFILGSMDYRRNYKILK